MSYPQFQAASDYLGAIADEDYVKALPSNSYEDRGGAVLDGPEAGYKVTYTQADAEAVTAEDGRVILMDEHLADSDAMDYDMDRADGEWALSDYVQKGIEVLDNDTGFFMMCEGGKIDWACFQPSPGRFPSSADGSGFTHLLLLLLGRKVLEISHDALFLWCFGNIQWIIILLYLELQRDEEYLREE